MTKKPLTLEQKLALENAMWRISAYNNGCPGPDGTESWACSRCREILADMLARNPVRRIYKGDHELRILTHRLNHVVTGCHERPIPFFNTSTTEQD